MIFRKTLKITHIKNNSPTSFELLEAELIQHRSRTLRFLFIYRPPTSPFNVFLDELHSLINSKLTLGIDLIMAGDFNIHVNVVLDSNARAFNQLLNDHGISQHVNESAHSAEHTLDLVCSSQHFSSIS